MAWSRNSATGKGSSDFLAAVAAASGDIAGGTVDGAERLSTWLREGPLTSEPQWTAAVDYLSRTLDIAD